MLSRTGNTIGTGAVRMEHSVIVAAPPAAVFGLVADVSAWPQVFGPTIHVELVEDGADEQLLQIWALAGGRVRSWASRRTLDHDTFTVGFRQVVSAPPVAAMGGQWQIQAAPDGGTEVVLRHDFRAVDDDPVAVEMIEDAVAQNSAAELAALRVTAELGASRDQLQLTFVDSTRIDGSPDDVFRFLDRAEQWPQRLPHVARLELSEDEPGIQHMEMDTRTPDGSIHTTKSVRICFPSRRLIVYKQLQPPEVMSGHTGRWEVEKDGDGVIARAWHTVVLNLSGVGRTLGPDTSLGEARGKVRRALGNNSSATLQRAKDFAERHRRA